LYLASLEINEVCEGKEPVAIASKKGNFWVVRFRIDVAEQFERKLRSVRLCPIEGEGVLSKTERHRKALDIIAVEEANSEDTFNQTESSTVTFREQSEK
jgi:hypothetical protein